MTAIAMPRVNDPRLQSLVKLLDRHLPAAVEKRPIEFVPVWLVQECVSRDAGVTIRELLSDSREKGISEVRQIAMYLAWKLCRASLNELAREFRRKDHTTIMYGCRKIRALTESDPRFNERMQKLLDAIIAVRRDLSENGFSEDDLRELVRS